MSENRLSSKHWWSKVTRRVSCDWTKHPPSSKYFAHTENPCRGKLFTCKVRIDSIHCVRSKSELRKNVIVFPVALFPILKTKFGDASTSWASKSASFFLCLSPALEPLDRCFFSSFSSSIIWSRTVQAWDFRWTMLMGLASFGSFTDSSQITMSFSGMNHFSSNSKPFRSRPAALYLAQAMTSLNRNRCRSFLWPSASSTMKEFFTKRRRALSSL